MAKKTETEIVEKILKWVEKHQGDGFHVHGSVFQRMGEPDIDASLPDGAGGYLHIKCEVKVPGEVPDRLQEHRIKVYQKHGYLAFWVDSLEGFIHAVESEKERRALATSAGDHRKTRRGHSTP